MTTRPVLLGLAILLTGCTGGFRHHAESNVADEAAVRRLEEQVAIATERNDADALAPYMAADFTFVNPGGFLLSK